MKAIHVNWTKPYFDRYRLVEDVHRMTKTLTSSTYDQPDYQIFYTMLSAIHWKKHNGPIKLYTDSIGLSFIQQFRGAELYDDIDIKFLNNYSKSNVDAARFWTSGKIKCLANQTKPFVFLDQDMIIRSSVKDIDKGFNLVIAHWEIPRGEYYFSEEDWNREIPHLKIPDNYDCYNLVPNTSFLIFRNMELLHTYTEWHKKLVNINEPNIPIWYWLLTDQGILGHVVRMNDYHVNTLTDKVFLPRHNFGDKETRYKGLAEPWYYPVENVDILKDKNIKWEHVWIEKIHYSYYPEYMELETQRFFNELVNLGYEKHLNHSRFYKYWKKYEQFENNKNILGK